MSVPMSDWLPGLVRAEMFKLRTVSLWWLFALATAVSTVVTLTVNIVNAPLRTARLWWSRSW